MKLYKIDKMTLKISNCDECPNKTVMTFTDRYGMPGIAVVCGAIRTTAVDEDGNNLICHPVLVRCIGGIMPNCPLEDV